VGNSRCHVFALHSLRNCQVTNNFRLLLCSRLFEESPASFCSHLLAMIQACTYQSEIFVKPQLCPTPSESIGIYCVRKLVSCVTHHQSCAKVDIWNKKKKLRTVAKIKTQDYKNWRLQNLSTIATPPLNTATTLFNIFTFHIYFLDCSCFLYKSTCCT